MSLDMLTTTKTYPVENKKKRKHETDDDDDDEKKKKRNQGYLIMITQHTSRFIQDIICRTGK